MEGYELPMAAGKDGRVRVALVNPDLQQEGRAVYLIYQKDQLPNFLEWRMMAESTYAVGIEPCTNSFGREAVRRRGEMIVLQPGETRSYDLEIGVLTGREQIENFTRGIQSVEEAQV
jgi:hypothetical protein